MEPTLVAGQGLIAVRSGRAAVGQLRCVEHPDRPGFWLVKRVDRRRPATARCASRRTTPTSPTVDSRHVRSGAGRRFVPRRRADPAVAGCDPAPAPRPYCRRMAVYLCHEQPDLVRARRRGGRRPARRRRAVAARRSTPAAAGRSATSARSSRPQEPSTVTHVEVDGDTLVARARRPDRRARAATSRCRSTPTTGCASPRCTR